MTGSTHIDTPKRARLRGICDYLQHHGLLGKGEHTREKVYEFCGVSDRSARRILKDREIEVLPRRTRRSLQELNTTTDLNARTRNNDHRIPETRGRKRAYSEAEVDEMEHLFLTEPYDSRRMPWGSLADAADVEHHHATTIRRHMHRRGYNTRKEQEKQALPPSTAKQRVERADRELESFSDPQQWKKYYFIDEVHFSYGPHGRGNVKRKASERNAWFVATTKKEPKQWDEKVLHAIAVVGWDYKSKLYWYKIPTNSNGKMTMDAYIPLLRDILGDLEAHLGHKDFILWQDNDSGHGKRRDSKVRKWMDANGYTTIFNASRSPDTNIIENCWKAPKSYIRKHEVWDIEDLRGWALEGWAALHQKTINDWVLTMPQRWRDVKACDGQLTAW